MLFHSLPNWCAKSGFYAPSASQSFIKSVSVNAKFNTPLSNCKIKPIIFKSTIGSGVVGLLFASSPSAIILGIPKAIVNTLKSHAFWPIAHITRKNLKTCSPFFTNSNPPATVVLVKFMGRIVTSIFNVLPNRIKRSLAFAVGGIGFVKVMGSGATPFAVEATARLRHARLEVVASNAFLNTAITQTQAMPACGFNNKPSKTLANNNWVNFLTGHKISFSYPITLNPNIGDVNYVF